MTALHLFLKFTKRNVREPRAALWKHLRCRNTLKQSFRAYKVFHNAAPGGF